MLLSSVGQSMLAMLSASKPTFAGSLAGSSPPNSLAACTGIVAIGTAWVLGAATVCAGVCTSAWGHQTRSPISCNMARWRGSRSRLMMLILSQTQAHHHGIFTLALHGWVIVFAQTDAAVT